MEEYTHYHEIYLSRHINGNHLYCLTEVNANKTFILNDQVAKGTPGAVPMVTFADMDGDGMMDAVLYHDKLIYVYYNKLVRKEYESTLGESFLCLLQSET